MRYTESGLELTIDELKRLAEQAEQAAKHQNMESVIYIQGGDRPRIVQFCGWHDCFPKYYTNTAEG